MIDYPLSSRSYYRFRDADGEHAEKIRREGGKTEICLVVIKHSEQVQISRTVRCCSAVRRLKIVAEFLALIK